MIFEFYFSDVLEQFHARLHRDVTGFADPGARGVRTYGAAQQGHHHQRQTRHWENGGGLHEFWGAIISFQVTETICACEKCVRPRKCKILTRIARADRWPHALPAKDINVTAVFGSKTPHARLKCGAISETRLALT